MGPTGTARFARGKPAAYDAHTPGATSLLPETHIAVVPASRIVRGMEDAWALLRAERDPVAPARCSQALPRPPPGAPP